MVNAFCFYGANATTPSLAIDHQEIVSFELTSAFYGDRFNPPAAFKAFSGADSVAGQPGLTGPASQASRYGKLSLTGWVVRSSRIGKPAQVGLSGQQILSCQFGNPRATLKVMFITFTNTKGGVAKSTLAAHLAIWLFDLGGRVALIDADIQGTSSEWIRNAEPKIAVRVATDSDAIQAARDELMAEHDFVIADAPGKEGNAADAVVFLADLAILPLEPTKPSVRALKEALKTIRLAHGVRQGKPETVLVLSKVRKNSRRTAVLKEQLRSSGYRVANAEIRFLDAIAESCDSAVTRNVTPTSQAAASDIETLFWELLGNRLTRRSAGNE